MRWPVTKCLEMKSVLMLKCIRKSEVPFGACHLAKGIIEAISSQLVTMNRIIAKLRQSATRLMLNGWEKKKKKDH